MPRPLTSIALVLVATAATAHAQPLSPKERTFAAAVAAVSSPVQTARAESGPPRRLELRFAGDLRLELSRYATPRRAFRAASQAALHPPAGTHPVLLEQRGRDLLRVVGPGLLRPQAANRIRRAAWQAFPWLAPTSRSSLLQLDLRGRGMVLRVNRPQGPAYAHLKALFDGAQSARLNAMLRRPPKQVQQLGPNETLLTYADAQSHLKVTSRHAIQVVSPDAPPQVLTEFVEVVRLPPSAGAGAAGVLGSLER